ncbi:MAG: T9SS type A sorting domain-containing protein [Bacteroidota bacterium]
MKKFCTAIFVLAVTLCVSHVGFAQAYIDTANFSLSAQFKPSDYAQWPDDVAAWRVYANYDLDNDGKKEFLVIVDPATTSSDTTMARILRFEATGNNTYALVWSAQLPPQNTVEGSWPCLTVGDLDKDTKQEIIFGLPSDARSTGNPNPGRVFIYEYDTDSSNFLSEPTMISNLGFRDFYYHAITSIVADDVDGDGEVELITSARRSYGNGSLSASTRPLFIYRLLGDVSPGFSSFELEFADTIGTFNGGYYFNNHVVDFDGDGKKEIWGFTWDMLTYAVYEATGANTYSLQADINQITNPDDYGEQNSVAFYDANKDGKLEMFIAGQVSTPSAVFYVGNTNDVSTLTAANTKWLTSPLNLNFQGADIGDIDGNGEVDFFIGDWGSDRKVYRLRHLTGMPYDDSTGYKLDTIYHAPSDSSYALPNVTFGNDLDGDGRRELIIVNTNTRIDHPEDVSLIILESKVVVQSVKTLSTTAPAVFKLDQNYPNPFNPTSKIRFSVTKASNIHLFISNTLGQQVGTLYEGMIEAGTHEVTFDAAGLAAGTYFYTLKAGNFTETKKMMLVK